MKILSIPALACAMTLGFGLASAQTITPTRVGPVSQYGQLMTGKNSAGEGRIYGSCEGVKDGAEVQVRGMSLYWSLQPQAVEYWSDEGVSTMVKDMNIQIVRAAMATGNEDWWGEWNGQRLKGYASAPDQQKGFMKAVVEAAIKNDIYVIIDWHSHEATSQVNSAKGFFEEMAKTYGQYDNVIFELFNEPTDISWDNIKNYANQIIPTIRQYSDNLILVGTRAWDQHPEEVIGKEVTDSKKNTAYTLHYYANSHCVSGNYDWGGSCEGANGEKAIKAGLSVFVSEWGTGNANGDGTPDQNKNTQWQTFINKYKLSWANWSASHISEGTAAFGSGSNKTSLNYTTSGNLVKGYLATNPTNYTKCAAGSQGGQQKGSTTDPSQGGQQGGQTPNPEAIIGIKAPNGLSVAFLDKSLEISGVKAANVELFDLKGNKLMMIDGVSGNLSLAAVPAGQYLVKVTAGSARKLLPYS
ncbi:MULTISPECIES: glycoside hydrolase family 5 protein [unclassified Fibrobacter]|uniref:glycoside hydrolase family 5 protein n=1 Tax=unclassified Fibrobacter TaxID=2634177 RepID=UPI000D7A5B13|nr:MULTISPECIES: glycoside hydrolase family 5 protein [unclassified Fibrobacter]PWJ71662.1 aryl-phospho-beta-D-glucosidase BglC (GH1 family) [Fibrobacter sp. UWR4]PZW65106.1 aryl-phospho-beta-D-glucosidase BglC (GH1 family) [Fibrobacter sp. UWR1]